MMHSCHQAKTTTGVQRKVITIILLRIIMFLVYLNDCLYLLDYLFTASGRTVVSQLSKLIIELDDKYDARGARLEKQMECLVNISQDRLAFE